MKRRLILIAALSTGLAFAGPACKKKEDTEAETTEAEEMESAADEAEGDKEGADEASEAEADGDKEGAMADDSGDTEEKKKVEMKPGEIPLDFPVVETDAEKGEYVLVPSKRSLERAYEKGSKKTSFIYYTAKVLEPGAKETKVKSLAGTEYSMPNALIIRVPKGEKAQKGDMVLSWWQSGSGMQRAYVVGGSPTEPKVRYMDVSFDNPSKVAKREDTLKPDSFKKLTGEKLEAGVTVACKDGSRHRHGIVTNMAEDKLLVSGFAASLRVFNKGDCQTVPVKVKVKKGDTVYVPYIGKFREATVEKVDSSIGRVFVTFEWGGKEKELAAAFGNVLTSLEGGDEPMKADKEMEDKDEKAGAGKNAPPAFKGVSGTYKGSVTAPKTSGNITLSFKGKKVTGNAKGMRGKERWLVGFSGSLKGSAFTASGTNKNTSLTVSGSVKGPVASGHVNGKINGKRASMRFTARK